MTDRTGDRAVEFGVFDWLDAHPALTAGELYEQRLALLRLADAGSFSRYHVAEHHGTPLGLAPSPGLFLAAAARETARIRLVATTFIVPLYDPLRLAEEIGMLDQLSHGRLEIGVGKGSSPIEAAMFGHGPEDMARRYAESTPAILDALRTGGFRGTPLFVPAVQRPHPPVWYPTSNPESLRTVAARGQHTVFGFGFLSQPLEVIGEHSATFFDAVPEATPAPHFGILRHAVVAGSDAEALAIAQRAFDAHLESFTHLWHAHGNTRYDSPPPVERLVEEGRFLCGSPGTVADQVAHAIRTAKVTYVACAFAFGDLSRPEAARSLTLFDGEVLPRVRGLDPALA